jgi:hypothetical protein
MQTVTNMIGESGYERLPGDAYMTPPWCVDSLLEHIELRKCVWEPAVGTGNIAEKVVAAGIACLASDINPEFHPRRLDHNRGPLDFLQVEEAPSEVQAIVTNPPYSLAQEFVEHALDLMGPVGGQVAMKNDAQAHGPNPFANLPRCGARNRAGKPCQRPASPKGRCYYHGGAPGSGAPFGNQNGWKHGRYFAGGQGGAPPRAPTDQGYAGYDSGA